MFSLSARSYHKTKGQLGLNTASIQHVHFTANTPLSSFAEVGTVKHGSRKAKKCTRNNTTAGDLFSKFRELDSTDSKKQLLVNPHRWKLQETLGKCFLNRKRKFGGTNSRKETRVVDEQSQILFGVIRKALNKDITINVNQTRLEKLKRALRVKIPLASEWNGSRTLRKNYPSPKRSWNWQKLIRTGGNKGLFKKISEKISQENTENIAGDRLGYLPEAELVMPPRSWWNYTRSSNLTGRKERLPPDRCPWTARRATQRLEKGSNVSSERTIGF